jgi:hypothetical protein
LWLRAIPQGGFLKLFAGRNPAGRDGFMDKDAREALQVTKEIMVKFIELRRISPTNFGEIFPEVYRVVLETISRPPGAERDRTE